MNKKARFIVFEGVDGVGKTTAAIQLVRELDRSIYTSEPGGTRLGESISKIIPEATSELTKLYLYQADRIQHIDQIIIPRLARGLDVVCDRFTLSTQVYQHDVHPYQAIYLLNRIAANRLNLRRRSAFLFLLTCDYEVARERNSPDKDLPDRETYNNLQDQYKIQCDRDNDQCYRNTFIDTSALTVDQVVEKCLVTLNER